VKAALFPLYFWLPAAYSNAAAPVAALFSIMTKVGVYAIIRVSTLIFGEDAGAAANLTSPWLLPLALATLALGAAGALGAPRLTTLAAYLTVASAGTLLTAVSVGGTAALAAALYYLAHSTLAVAILFLLADLIGRQRGSLADLVQPGPPLRGAALLGLAFVAAAATVAGVPPFSGFLGKLMVLQGVHAHAAAGVIWAVVLGTSFVTLVACARAGSLVLWNVSGGAADGPRGAPQPGEWLALGTLIASSAMLVVFAAPVTSYLTRTAEQLGSPSGYVEAVLGRGRDGLIRGFSTGEAR